MHAYKLKNYRVKRKTLKAVGVNCVWTVEVVSMKR